MILHAIEVYEIRTTGVSLFLCGTSSDERNSFVLTCERFCRHVWQHLKEYRIYLLHIHSNLSNVLPAQNQLEM